MKKTNFISTEEIYSWFTSYCKNKQKHKENKVLPQSPPARPLERTLIPCHSQKRAIGSTKNLKHKSIPKN